MATLSIRIDFGPDRRIGPGKVRLLEAIAEQGSIAAGGRALGMSYRRAWELVEELNTLCGRPVVTPKSGGAKGGGAELTATGQALIRCYRAVEKSAASAAAADMNALNRALARGKPRR
jgi:molybdate transport system regulatory protein